jgi:hypothetical protein
VELFSIEGRKEVLKKTLLKKNLSFFVQLAIHSEVSYFCSSRAALLGLK